MSAALDFPLSGSGPLVRLAASHGFRTFAELAGAIARLPYGRVRDADDVAAVLKEHKGTCSSKHRLLAATAHECGRAEVRLVVGLYGMCEENTPGVGAALAEVGAIPEAHCYLMHQGERLDFTGLPAGAASPFDALVEEHVVAYLGHPCPRRQLLLRCPTSGIHALAFRDRRVKDPPYGLHLTISPRPVC